MFDGEERLILCFSAVFPELNRDEIRNATADSVGVWDSLSTVTLAALIQEEFNFGIEPDILPGLDSFQAFRDCLFAAGSGNSRERT